MVSISKVVLGNCMSKLSITVCWLLLMILKSSLLRVKPELASTILNCLIEALSVSLRKALSDIFARKLFNCR